MDTSLTDPPASTLAADSVTAATPWRARAAGACAATSTVTTPTQTPLTSPAPLSPKREMPENSPPTA